MADALTKLIAKLPGPIVITGAGGFVGVNLAQTLLAVRDDVLAVSHNPAHNWRFVLAKIPKKVQKQLDLTDERAVRVWMKRYRPGTVFHLAAYGAYSKQADFARIYETNFFSTVTLLEVLKNTGGRMVTAGSSSEYGLNASGPKEAGVLMPNSHYAVSKIGAYYAGAYYGKIHQVPITHARLYAVYGPWEEPDRLIPRLIEAARKGGYPPLVNPRISRDFIYVADVVSALVTLAATMKKRDYGEAFNIGTGTKTTMRELARVMRAVATLPGKPVFGTMPARAWDVIDWYGNVSKMHTRFGFKVGTGLVDGLSKTLAWQEAVGYDRLLKEWNR